MVWDGWFICQLVGWLGSLAGLISWTVWVARSVSPLVHRPLGWFVGLEISWSVGQSFGQNIYLLVVTLVRLPSICLSLDWLVDWLVVWSIHQIVSVGRSIGLSLG